MNKKYLLAVLAMFVATMLTDFVVHGLLLHADYLELPAIMRTEADSQRYMQWMLLAHVFIAFSMVWIYQRGREAKPWLAQGLRFGIAIACLTAVPTYLIYYAVEPLPGMLVVKQIVFDVIRTMGLGVLIAWIYR